MKITAQEEYGLRCILQMARRGPGDPTTIAELAVGESLSPAYVGKLMRVLRKSGLVKSIRGQKGGYALTRPAGQISVLEVLEVLGGRLFSDEFCSRHAGNDRDCVHLEDCGVRSVFSGIERLIGRVLGGCRLTDLIRSEKELEGFVESRAGVAFPVALGCPAAARD
jgi:Rrf2 family protein